MRETNIKGLFQYKKFIRYEEGADIYGVSLNTFKKLASDAGAIYRINGFVLVNMDILDKYLNEYREAEQVDLAMYDSKTPLYPQKYIKYADAILLYSIKDRKLRELAKHARVVSKIGGYAMIDVAAFENYLNQYHETGR